MARSSSEKGSSPSSSEKKSLVLFDLVARLFAGDVTEREWRVGRVEGWTTELDVMVDGEVKAVGVMMPGSLLLEVIRGSVKPLLKEMTEGVRARDLCSIGAVC